MGYLLNSCVFYTANWHGEMPNPPFIRKASPNPRVSICTTRNSAKNGLLEIPRHISYGSRIIEWTLEEVDFMHGIYSSLYVYTHLFGLLYAWNCLNINFKHIHTPNFSFKFSILTCLDDSNKVLDELMRYDEWPLFLLRWFKHPTCLHNRTNCPSPVLNLI